MLAIMGVCGQECELSLLVLVQNNIQSIALDKNMLLSEARNRIDKYFNAEINAADVVGIFWNTFRYHFSLQKSCRISFAIISLVSTTNLLKIKFQ